MIHGVNRFLKLKDAWRISVFETKEWRIKLKMHGVYRLLKLKMHGVSVFETKIHGVCMAYIGF